MTAKHDLQRGAHLPGALTFLSLKVTQRAPSIMHPPGPHCAALNTQRNIAELRTALLKHLKSKKKGRKRTEKILVQDLRGGEWPQFSWVDP